MTDPPSKEAYEKPELLPIDLAAEEVLAIGCKLPSGSRNVGRPACGLAVPCSRKGS